MRSFIMHTFDKSASFNLNGLNTLATEPTGLGNAFALSYKDSEKGKHLVNVKPEFEAIKLKIYFNADGTNGYTNYKSLLSFLATCGTSKFLFEYVDGITDKYCEVVLKTMPKSEINEDGIFVEEFTFERQTYWYEQVEETIALRSTEAESTAFPLGFPFGFIGKVVQQRYKINNKFFIDSPVTITISGYIPNNLCIYISKLNGDIVEQIQLLTGNTDGTTIVIEPTNKKITVYDAEGNATNGYGLTDKTQQSFLYLPQGEYYIGSNMDDASTGKIEMTIKRYMFD